MHDAQRLAREKGRATLFVPFRKNMQVRLLGLSSTGLALACAGERKTKLATVGHGKKLT